jgi:hypothetical protein
MMLSYSLFSTSGNKTRFSVMSKDGHYFVTTVDNLLLTKYLRLSGQVPPGSPPYELQSIVNQKFARGEFETADRTMMELRESDLFPLASHESANSRRFRGT